MKNEEFVVASHEEDLGAEVDCEDSYGEDRGFTSTSPEDKDLVSHIPLQVCEFNDESFDDLKREDFIKKLFEGEELSSAPSPSCEEEH